MFERRKPNDLYLRLTADRKGKEPQEAQKGTKKHHFVVPFVPLVVLPLFSFNLAAMGG